MKHKALLFALLALAGTQICVAWAPGPKTYITEKTREIDGGRKVLIIMPQPTPSATVKWNPRAQVFDDVTVLTFNSPAEMERYNEEVREAQRIIAPLQTALASYDRESKVRGAIEPIVTRSPWVRGQNVEVAYNPNNTFLLRKLDESKTQQMLVVFLENRCDVACKVIAISLKATMLVRKIPSHHNGSVRLSGNYIPYQVSFNAVVNLRDPDPNNAEVNRDRWAANDAALARRAIDFGTDWVIDRFVRNLDETREQNEQWSSRGDRKGTLANGRAGWVISRSANELVYFDARSNSLTFETTIEP